MDYNQASVVYGNVDYNQASVVYGNVESNQASVVYENADFNQASVETDICGLYPESRLHNIPYNPNSVQNTLIF